MRDTAATLLGGVQNATGGATAGGFKYDNVSIYSGSATVGPGGIPRMVYPGMCAGNCAHGHMTPPTDCYPLCKTGFTYGLVVPANLSDPLYSVWKKPDYNPIVSRRDFLLASVSPTCRVAVDR